MIQLPQILDIPNKLLPVLTEFNNYRFFLCEGGRGGGKSHSIARILLFIAEKRKVRIVCGREIQSSIRDSVKTILDDIIKEYNLNYTIKDERIIHNVTGSVFLFKGFREQGKINIKGLEGVDILWVDESQALTIPTLEVLIPTIRKENSKMIFTLNRLMRWDPVYVRCINDPDCLHIKINYYDNHHCPKELVREAEKCKMRNPKEYDYVWEGNPQDSTNDYLLASSKLDAAQKLKQNSEQGLKKHSVLSVDLAGSGGDLNTAKIITQVNSTGWEETHTFNWSEPDTDVTTGKIISLYSKYKPDILVIDGDGVGYAIAVNLKNTLNNVVIFRGAGKVKNTNSSAINARAEGYLLVREFINNSWLKLNDDETVRQLEYIKIVYNRNGTIKIQSKEEIRKEQGESPDYADCLMMALYAIDKFSYMLAKNNDNTSSFGYVDSDFDPFD